MRKIPPGFVLLLRNRLIDFRTCSTLLVSGQDAITAALLDGRPRMVRAAKHTSRSVCSVQIRSKCLKGKMVVVVKAALVRQDAVHCDIGRR